jgi:hypothetical protein
MTFDPTKSAGSSNDFQNLPVQKVMIYLHAAVTNEGFLVITNAPNVADVYAPSTQGMLANATFSQAFTSPNQSITGLGYFNFDTLRSYVDSLMTAFTAPADVSTDVDGILKPWHDIFTLSLGTPDTATATGNVNVDTAGFSTYPNLFSQLFTTAMQNPTVEQAAGEVTSGITNDNLPAKTFCDVSRSDWYAGYVNDLSGKGIVSGYANGCFMPDNQITRAEFIKMLAQVEGLTAANSGTDLNKEYFTDIPSSNNAIPAQWYAADINNAAAAGIITGYKDGSFRPDATITRAEAVQILYNSSSILKSVATVANFTQFSDVRNTDWDMLAIHAAFSKGLIQGTGAATFNPNGDLTRAQAAKIISLFMSLAAGK